MENQNQKINPKLLDSIKRIYYNKFFQSKGFEILTKKTKDKRTKDILQRFNRDEKSLADFWYKKIKQFKDSKIKNNFLLNIRTKFMYRILGVKGFFKWTIDAEIAAIQNFEIEIEKIKDPNLSQELTRMAIDERLHLERLKSEFLGIEAWTKEGGGGVRDMIFGLNDGLVSTLAFVVGVYAGLAESQIGGFTGSQIILISGIAELLAGSISMAVSSYQSTKSEIETLDKKQHQSLKKSKNQEENQDLINFYQKQGLTLNEAKAIVERIQENKTLKKQRKILDKLGLSHQTSSNPINSGLLCGFSFAIAALVPVIPYALPIDPFHALIISIIASVFALFTAGVLKTIFSQKNWLKSGLEMMIIGIGASTITYFIGTLVALLL